MGGRMSPSEAHARYAFPIHAKCEGCGARPSIRAVTMIPFKDACADNPAIAAMLLAHPDSVMSNVVDLKGPDGLPRPHFRAGVAYSCRQCQASFERALAKLPSWVIVDINRGVQD